MAEKPITAKVKLQIAAGQATPVELDFMQVQAI